MSKLNKMMKPLIFAALSLSVAACSEVQFITQASKTISKSSPEYHGDVGTKSGGPVLGDPTHGGNGGYYKIGKSYKIKGKWYYPKEDYDYVEQGVASWYGPGFHGKKTANGAIFDMYKVSAAHRTLPLPSVVRVTNLENGRSLKVKVNDRGPYAHNRIIDLSKRGAQLLGFEHKGTALVRVEVLEAESRLLSEYMQAGKTRKNQPPKPTAAPTISIQSENLSAEGIEISKPTSKLHNVEVASLQKVAPIERVQVTIPQEATTVSVETVSISKDAHLFVQAGAFTQYSNAVKTRALLSSVGKVVIQQINKGSQPLFRVRVGPFENVQRADEIQQAIVDAGYSDAQIIVDTLNRQ